MFGIKIFVVLCFIDHTSYSQKEYFKLNDSIFEINAILRYSIHFQLNTSSIRNESYLFLDSVSRFLKEHKNLRIEVGCHLVNCKSIKKKNLSLERAKAIGNYLIVSGVSKEQLVLYGYECSRPLYNKKYMAKLKDDKEIEKALMMNDRTEFKIVDLKDD